MKYNKRQIIGLTIWWTEGTKSYLDKRWKNTWVRNVDVTNTNPEIIKLFLKFLRKDIGIDETRLKAQLQIHQGDNKENIENYWSKIINIPRARFTKTIIRPTGNKIGKNKGTCKVRYSDKSIYLKLESFLTKMLKRI
ncbi:hypothetical protein KJ866_04290 [Patescibacteria group bacterium]|nr:hypothetical protein [Patescibacteria group bacterium]MBU2219614.1 hypothetical protein [Patescibacteria group bacterium]MBU2265349.1 hypothetical protein [Patescibacteria group bacterium]